MTNLCSDESKMCSDEMNIVQMIFFTLKYLNTSVLDTFRIKKNECSFSMKVCLAIPLI